MNVRKLALLLVLLLTPFLFDTTQAVPMNYKGQWNPSVVYPRGSVVLYQGATYLSLKSNPNAPNKNYLPDSQQGWWLAMNSTASGPSGPVLYDADGQELGIYVGRSAPGNVPNGYEVYIKSLRITVVISSTGGNHGEVYGSGRWVYLNDRAFFKTANCTGQPYITAGWPIEESSIGNTVYKSSEDFFVIDQLTDLSSGTDINSTITGVWLFADPQCTIRVDPCITNGTTYFELADNFCRLAEWVPSTFEGFFYAYTMHKVELPFTTPVKFPLHFK